MKLKFTQSTRRHRVGRGSARYVIEHSEPVHVTPATEAEPEWRTWIAEDERGRELEIIAGVFTEYLLVIHVFPTALRRSGHE